MSQAVNDLMRAMMGKLKGPKPEGATTIYRVNWHLRSDSFDGMTARIGSSVTTTRLHKTRSFVSQEKAQKLVEQLQEAFKTLDYGLEGLAYIEEDWYE